MSLCFRNRCWSLAIVLWLSAACASQPASNTPAPVLPTPSPSFTPAASRTGNALPVSLMKQVENDLALADEPHPTREEMLECAARLFERTQFAISHLLSAPAANRLSSPELQDIVNTGAQNKVDVLFFDTQLNVDAALVAIYPGFCRALHYSPPRYYYVLDREQNKWSEAIGWAGPFAPSVFSIPNGWVAEVPTSFTSDLGSHATWHIYRGETGWTKRELFAYHTGSLQLSDEYRRLSIQYMLYHVDARPCQFRPDVEAAIAMVNFDNGLRTYVWKNGEYALVSDTHETTVVLAYYPPSLPTPSSPAGLAGKLENWQDYCVTLPFPRRE